MFFGTELYLHVGNDRSGDNINLFLSYLATVLFLYDSSCGSRSAIKNDSKVHFLNEKNDFWLSSANCSMFLNKLTLKIPKNVADFIPFFNF